MTDIEKKALALVTQLQEEDDGKKYSYAYYFEALCRTIEQHEAFKQEVSDAVEGYASMVGLDPKRYFARFIIAKPDPLVEALGELADRNMEAEQAAETLRAAIEARGGRIVWEGEDA